MHTQANRFELVSLTLLLYYVNERATSHDLILIVASQFMQDVRMKILSKLVSRTHHLPEINQRLNNHHHQRAIPYRHSHRFYSPTITFAS